MTCPARPSTTCDGVSAAPARPHTAARTTSAASALRLVALFEIVLIDSLIVQLLLFLRRGAARDHVVDLLPASLHVGVADEDVVVERRLLGVPHLIEVARAFVDDVDPGSAQ